MSYTNASRRTNRGGGDDDDDDDDTDVHRSDNSNGVVTRTVPTTGSSSSSKKKNANPDDPHNLYERFVVNQKRMFPKALEEIRRGMKRSCWLWFVLPSAPYVVNGIERGSKMNRYYALRGDDAVKAYLEYEHTYNITFHEDADDEDDNDEDADDEDDDDEDDNDEDDDDEENSDDEECNDDENNDSLSTRTISLRDNYLEILAAIVRKLEVGFTLSNLLGSLDVDKALSSVRLFRRIANEVTFDDELAALCNRVLELVAVSKKRKHKRYFHPKSNEIE